MSDRMPEGAKRVGPGIYEVGDELHIDAVELCEEQGIEPTEANQQVVAEAARQVFGGEGVPIETRDAVSETLPPRFADTFDEDALIAGVELVGRSGAHEVEFGWTKDDKPIEDSDWYAFATFRGARVITEHHPGPVQAVEALARKLLRGGTCRRCGEPIILSGPAVLRGCRWARKGNRWTPGCDKPIDESIPTRPAMRR